MIRFIKILFFGLIIKPIVLVVLGLNLHNREKLPQKGPAIIAANHNSHLDTMVLMSLYPLLKVHKVRPVAAADYFLSNPLLAWFSLNVLGIIPLSRKGFKNRKELFSECHKALDQGDILILFPEGTRGKPEEISTLKKGIYYLTEERENVSVTPVVMHGLGRALPRGEALLVPFNCDVIIGEELPVANNPNEQREALEKSYAEMLEYCLTRNTLV